VKGPAVGFGALHMVIGGSAGDGNRDG